MITIHCIDVSGAISHKQIQRAQEEIFQRKVDGDLVVIFDTNYKIINNFDNVIDIVSSHCNSHVGRGGTDATSLLDMASKMKAKTTIYSDGYLPIDQLNKFTNFVELK